MIREAVLEVFQPLSVFGVYALNDIGQSVEALVDAVESAIDGVEPLVHGSKTGAHLREAEPHFLSKLLEFGSHRRRDADEILLDIVDAALDRIKPLCGRPTLCWYPTFATRSRH